MSTRPLYFASLLALALPACAGQTDAAIDDASIDDDAKADRAGGGSSYYLVRSDAKGNSYVKRVNFTTTTCSDGRSAGECNVAAVDYAPAKLDQNDMAAVSGMPMIVRGGLSQERPRRQRSVGRRRRRHRRQRLRHRQRRRLSRARTTTSAASRRPATAIARPSSTAPPRATSPASTCRRSAPPTTRSATRTWR